VLSSQPFFRPRFLLALLALSAASTALCAEPPKVAVSPVIRGEGAREVTFDAELRPYREIELHAKVTGYIDALKVDVGDIVKEGQVIASLDVPELKSELEHAMAEQRRSYADVERATADAEEAHLTFTRITATDKAQPRLIAAQELDSARAKDRSSAAHLQAAQEQAKVAEAEAKKLETMVGYAQITAPFPGVITRRNADVGSLIQAGTSSGAMPLVRLSQNDKLRVVFPVSISYVSEIKVGDPVEIRVRGVTQPFQGAVARIARKVETATRTMEAEVDLENADLALIPGVYAEVVVKMQQRKDALFVPVESILREKSGATLYVVNAQNAIEERKVTLGLETPTQIEVLSGARENEKVIVGGRSQVNPGQKVSPKVVTPIRLN
jgi:RND family efflux transporter MFP subunit